MGTAQAGITSLLHSAAEGDQQARASLLEVVYQELHRLAAKQMHRERFDHTLQPTALVHEAYMKLFDERQRNWVDRGHFFALAARVMRNILVDHARRHHAQRHGGDAVRMELDQVPVASLPPNAELIALDRALDRLATLDARQSQIVELRFFGGLTEEEIAELLKIGLRTVKRDWAMAKAWLYKELASKEKELASGA